jgi:hypothetical protein
VATCCLFGGYIALNLWSHAPPEALVGVGLGGADAHARPLPAGAAAAAAALQGHGAGGGVWAREAGEGEVPKIGDMDIVEVRVRRQPRGQRGGARES